MTDPLLSNLTPDQLAAVTTEATNVLVIAAAGSGKTRTLIRRALHLTVNRGCSASNLLLLTFSRKAGAEMRERMQSLAAELVQAGAMRESEVSRAIPWAGTFHAWCYRVLRDRGEALGYRRGLVVLDEPTAETVLHHVAEDLGFLQDGKWRRGMTGGKIERRAEQRLASIPAASACRNEELILDTYTALLRELNVIDLRGLIAETHRLFIEHPAILAEYRSTIRHVIVDELQDTDARQAALIRLLAPPAAFFGVGDPRQRIYGWRGADGAILDDPDAAVIHLRENFRSAPTIVRAANNLISHADGPPLPPMIAAAKLDPYPIDIRTMDDAALVRAVHWAMDPDGANCKPEQIAVLARTNQAVRIAHKALQHAGIPAVRVGRRFDICQTRDFATILACMRLAANQHDNLAFSLLRGALGISPQKYAAVRAAAGHGSHFAAWFVQPGPHREIGLSDLIALHHELLLGQPDAPASTFTLGEPIALADLLELRRVPTTVRFVQLALAYCNGAIAAEWGQQIVEFWQDSVVADLNIYEALKWFGLRDEQDDLMRKGTPAVECMTVHASKGLEWPTVILYGLSEGVFPSKRNDPEDMRTCYVAVTRAMETLILGPLAAGSLIPAAAGPSRFIDMMRVGRNEVANVPD